MKLNKRLDHVLKYYNLFSFIIIKYVLDARSHTTLLDVYKFTSSPDSRASRWDVFDGMMWICSIIVAMILSGYLFF